MPTPTKPVPFETHLAYFLDSRSTRASGIRVVEPANESSQARRGNLYVLVELMGESPVHNQALRQIQATVEDVYYTAAGSVSALLEKAILTAHEDLRQINQRHPRTDLRAGIICAALVNNFMVLSSAGPSLAMISTSDRLDQFPPGPRHYTGPLGGDTPPQLSLYRHQMEVGDVVFLGESDWILLTTIKTLGGAVATATPENRFDVVDYLRRQSNHAEILGLLLIAAPKSTGITAARRQDSSGLPTALGATPPLRSMPVSTDPIPPQQHVDKTTAGPPVRARSRAGSGFRQVARPQQTPSAQIDAMEPVKRRGASYAAKLRQFRMQPALSQSVALALHNMNVWTRKISSQIAGLARNVLPDRTEQPAPPPDWVGAIPTLDVSDDESDPSKAAPPFAPPERTRGGQARLFILLAILIPLLTFATVGAVYLQRGAANQSEGIKLVELAESHLLKAQQALDVDDENTARAALGEAQRYLDEAIPLIGITDRIRTLSEQIQVELQSVLQIRALYSLDFPLHEFPADAEPQRVIVFDQDIYVLDTGRQVVEYFRTDPSRSIVQENNGVILREGDVVEGVTVGRLVDIAWQPRIPGFADKASLLILDRNNNLFRYNNVDEVTYLRLASTDQLRTISQVESYGGRLYLIDEQQNQIWRYSPAGTGYEQAPDPWFADQVQTNLAGVVSTAIDGDIWMLTEDGMILRYRQGGQLPFSLDNSAGLSGRMVDMTLGVEVTDSLYLADGSQDRILVFDKQGNYIEQFQAAENNALRGLRGLYLDNVTGTLFILTQSSLYAHSLPR